MEIDADTRDVAGLSDAQLIDAMVGFERLAGWAQARQARVLAEFARRRPGDDPTAMWHGEIVSADDGGATALLTREAAASTTSADHAPVLAGEDGRDGVTGPDPGPPRQGRPRAVLRVYSPEINMS